MTALHVSERLTGAQAVQVAKVLDVWFQASGVDVRLELGEAPLARRVPAPDGVWGIDWGDPKRESYGESFYESQRIVLDRERIEADGVFLSVVAHEVGHAIGAYDHTKTGLMSRERDRRAPVCIDQAAIDELCAWRECRWERVVCLEP